MTPHTRFFTHRLLATTVLSLVGVLLILLLLIWGSEARRSAALLETIREKPDSLAYVGLGANETVSGSMHLLFYGNYCCALDVGSFYGKDEKRGCRITRKIAQEVGCVILSHVHLDHCGRLYQLIRMGYEGPIYCSEITKKLLPVMMHMALEYGGGFGEEKMEYSKLGSNYHQTPGRSWESKSQGRFHVLHTHKQCQYRQKISRRNKRVLTTSREKINRKKFALCDVCHQLEIEDIVRNVEAVPVGQTVQLTPRLSFSFTPTPHIPGAMMTTIKDAVADKTLLFTGDAGSGLSFFLAPQQEVGKPDVIIMEGTYGYSPSTNMPSKTDFLNRLNICLRSGRNVIIPAFVLDRSQQIIALVKLGVEAGYLPMNAEAMLLSPSANKITKIYEEVLPNIPNAGLSSQFRQLVAWNQYYQSISSIEQWERSRHCILITSSGMASMGFSKELLKKYVENPDTTFMFVGYQDPDEEGGILLRAQKDDSPYVLIDGEKYMRRAQFEKFDGFSGHAKFSQLCSLLEQARGFKKVLLVHHDADTVDKLISEYSSRFPEAEFITTKSGKPLQLY